MKSCIFSPLNKGCGITIESLLLGMMAEVCRLSLGEGTFIAMGIPLINIQILIYERLVDKSKHAPVVF